MWQIVQRFAVNNHLIIPLNPGGSLLLVLVGRSQIRWTMRKPTRTAEAGASLGALSAVAVLAIAMPCWASGTAQGSLTIAAIVANTCTVTNASLNFGTVDPAVGTSLSASSNILVQCSMGTNYVVSLDNGLNAAGAQRRMKGAASAGFLSYVLYADAAGTRPFASGAGQTVSATGLGASANSIPVYGSIPTGQSSPADSYGDTVAITVTY